MPCHGGRRTRRRRRRRTEALEAPRSAGNLVLSARPPTSHLSRRTRGPFCQADIGAGSRVIQIYTYRCYCAQQSGECSIVEYLGWCLPGRPCWLRRNTSPSHASWAARSPGRPLPHPRPRPRPRPVFPRPVAGGAYLAGLGKAGRPAGEEEGSLVGGEACVPAGSRQIFNACHWQEGEGARGGRQCRKDDIRRPCEPG